MAKTSYVRVDESSTITCQELEDLARRVRELAFGVHHLECSKEFTRALWSLRMPLLNVSRIIKSGRAMK